MSSTVTGGRGRRLTFAASGLLLALGVGLLWWALGHQVGEPPSPAAQGPVTAPSQPGDGVAVTTDPPERAAPGADAPARTATPDAAARTQTPEAAADPQAPAATGDRQPEVVEPLPASEPVRVSIPSIGVTSPLHPLGLDEEGRLEVPSGERYDEAAWYAGSPTPGEVGPAVIEGHVTSQGSVPSVFFELGALVPGDLVEVARADGTSAVFEVYGAESFPKDSFPKATVYGNTNGPELRLITCGGAYDPERRAHVDNIVVFARLVAPPGPAS